MKYWQKRAVDLENQTYNLTKKNYKKIDEAFSKAQAKINEKIEKWYVRLAKNNDIDIASAKKLLDKNELEEFKWTLDEYIKYGQENAIDQRWLRELENASAKYHISKLNAELLEIRAEYEKAFAKENEVVEETIKQSYTDRYDHMAFEIQKGYGVGFKVAGVDSEKLDKVIQKPWAPDGKNFSDRIWTKKEQMVDTLHGELIRSMLTGGNTKDAIKIMQRYVSKDVKNAKYAAARLIRTESSYFASEGQKECFKDLDVEKYEIVATLDNRTSDICQGMDGQIFDMKDFETGVTAPPFHVNCRSTTAPYFDDEFSLGERAARGEDGKTYYVPSDMTYKEWKGKQDETPIENNNKQNNIIIPNGYDINKHSKEIKNANIINNEYGGNIQMLNERVDQKTADMLWNDKLWEIKNVSSHSSIDHAIRNGLKQIIDNQGGIILNIDNSKLELDEIKNVIQKRFNRAGEEYKNLNVILVKNDKILENITIEKEAFPSAKKGTSSTSYTQNTTTKPVKSQLKSDAKNGKIVSSGNDYVDLKTIQEAEDYAKNTLGISNVYYKGLDIEVANEINKSLKEAFEYSDKVKDKIYCVGSGQKRNEECKKELIDLLRKRLLQRNGIDATLPQNKAYDNGIKNYVNKNLVKNIEQTTIAFTPTYSSLLARDKELFDILDKYKGVFINEKYAKDAKFLKDTLNRLVATKDSPEGCNTPKSLFDHELGHIIDDIFGLSTNQEVVLLYDEFNNLSSDDERNNALCVYAYRNNNKKPIMEFIAEAYSEFKNNANPRYFAKRVGEIIERMI